MCQIKKLLKVIMIFLVIIFWKAQTSSTLAEPSEKLDIKTILYNIPEQNFAKLHSNSGNYYSVKSPLVWSSVVKEFSSGVNVLTVDDGLLKDSKFVEVEEPEEIGQIALLMMGLANVEYSKAGYGYSLNFYITEEGKPRFFIQKGKNFLYPKITPHNFLVTPDGKRMILFAVLAHTHIFGSPRPCSQDIASLGSGFLQKYSSVKQEFGILVIPGGVWVLFHRSGKVIYGTNELASKKITYLFSK